MSRVSGFEIVSLLKFLLKLFHNRSDKSIMSQLPQSASSHLRSDDLYHLDIVDGGPALGIHVPPCEPFPGPSPYSRGIASFLRARLVLSPPVSLPSCHPSVRCSVPSLSSTTQQLSRSLTCRFLWALLWPQSPTRTH